MYRPLLFCLTLVLGLAHAVPAQAAIKLPSVFGEDMVLQRDMPAPIWGWAEPGEMVTVEFAGQKKTATADAKGNWKVVLDPLQADVKYRPLTIASKTDNLKIAHVLVGDVWIGSGQSNMEQSVNGAYDSAKVKAGADNNQIRLYHVPKVNVKEPAKDIKASWKICSPQTVGNFSAVLYHFGSEIQRDLGVPVGLINSSWGGSPIEPWIVTEKTSGGMYNGMIAPLQPLAIRGVLWYQGESNVGQGMKYRDKMEDLILGWRKVFHNEFPFYFVQIAPWSGYKASLPDLWEAQAASLKIPKTGMIVAADLVDKIGDIHPGNKAPFGHRLALIAKAKTYGLKNIVYSGPMYKAMKTEGNKIRVVFAHTGMGLKASDGKALTTFEIAAADGKYVPATAEIDGMTVVVSAPGVEQPAEVRFGWTNTANPNLVNSAGLPAAPFRTKNWQGGTGE